MIALNTDFREGPRPDRPQRMSARGILRGTIMPEDRHDLCATCDHASTCASHAELEQRAFECEEYAQKSRTPQSGRGRRARRCGDARPDDGQLHGLCSDCENRQRCTLHTLEGGVWHCEEYC